MKTVTADVEVRDGDGQAVAKSQAVFVDVGGWLTNPDKIVFDPISGLGRKSATVTTAHISYDGAQIPIRLTFAQTVRDRDTFTFESGALRLPARKWREGFDPARAATWSTEELAVYETGYREGGSNRDADVTIVAQDYPNGDQDIIDRLIAGGWTPPNGSKP